MKTLKITILGALGALLLTINVNAQEKALNSTVNTIITNYMALKNTLITGDGTAAEPKAKVLII